MAAVKPQEHIPVPVLPSPPCWGGWRLWAGRHTSMFSKASQMSTRSCSGRWTRPPHKGTCRVISGGRGRHSGLQLRCWMLVLVPLKCPRPPGSWGWAQPGAIICWDSQAGCPSCVRAFSSSSQYGCTDGVPDCPRGGARFHCPQSCSPHPGHGCGSLSWIVSCHCAAGETKRKSTVRAQHTDHVPARCLWKNGPAKTADTRSSGSKLKWLRAVSTSTGKRMGTTEERMCKRLTCSYVHNATSGTCLHNTLEARTRDTWTLTLHGHRASYLFNDPLGKHSGPVSHYTSSLDSPF
jgi:hypothetical protein